MTKLSRFIPAALFGLLVADFYLIFVVAPEEATQGLVQKIFYFHVSSAFAMYAGFVLSGLFALLYLIRRKTNHFCHCIAGATIGFLFCSMVLASGPIWAYPIWGTWWTWDPRLTTTLVLWLIFFSAILIHRIFEDDPRGRVFTSIVVLFGVLDIPLVFFAVKLWRGIHPSVLGEEKNMPTEMKIALIATNLTVLALFAFLYRIRLRMQRIEEALTQPPSFRGAS